MLTFKFPKVPQPAMCISPLCWVFFPLALARFAITKIIHINVYILIGKQVKIFNNNCILFEILLLSRTILERGLENDILTYGEKCESGKLGREPVI